MILVYLVSRHLNLDISTLDIFIVSTHYLVIFLPPNTTGNTELGLEPPYPVKVHKCTGYPVP